MKAPFIVITYGFSQKLFSYEEEGVHKLPIFGEAILAYIFLKSAKEKMEEFLGGKDPLQVQICGKQRHAIDMFRIVAVTTPGVTLVYNAAPMVEDPQAAVGKIAKELQSPATVINREYAIDDWIEELAKDQSEESETEE